VIRWVLLLALATPVWAQGLFDPPAANRFTAFPGARERYAESLALLKERLENNNTDVAGLERMAQLATALGRTGQLIESLRVIVRTRGLTDAHRAKLRGLFGHMLVSNFSLAPGPKIVQLGGRGIRIQIGPGNRAPARKAYMEAVEHLRAAIAADPRDARAKEDLAKALLGLKRTDEEAKEAEELKAQARALRLVQNLTRPPPIDLTIPAQQTREHAESLEQRKQGPDHARALALRKRALVDFFCTRTIAYTYEPSVFESVALLAPEHIVQEYLIRTYVNSKGDLDAVPVHYLPARPEKRREIIRALASDQTANAAAVLLALIMANRQHDSSAGEAVTVLAAAQHPAVVETLAGMIDTELFLADRSQFLPFAVRRLVRLAGEMKLETAAPILLRGLTVDTALDRPLFVARALGALGREPEAEVLLGFALDRDQDVFYRREAVAALARIRPDRLDVLKDEPLLEIAIAGARYRREPSDALRGRILIGIGREHEIDEACDLCLEFQIEEAIPLLEDFVQQRKTHYGIDGVKTALKVLQSRARGS